VFDLNTLAWTISSMDSAHRPSARYGHGLTLVGSKLYVHGGVGSSGNAFACLPMKKGDAEKEHEIAVAKCVVVEAGRWTDRVSQNIVARSSV
jgi:hypothetical protein